MSESTWEGHTCSAGQEIPCLLWNPKVHYLVHKNSPLDPVFSRVNLKIRLNIILSPTLELQSGFFHLDLKTISHVRSACSTPLILLDLITRTILGEQYKVHNTP
jgi:hypothetical protein